MRIVFLLIIAVASTGCSARCRNNADCGTGLTCWESGECVKASADLGNGASCVTDAACAFPSRCVFNRCSLPVAPSNTGGGGGGGDGKGQGGGATGGGDGTGGNSGGAGTGGGDGAGGGTTSGAQRSCETTGDQNDACLCLQFADNTPNSTTCEAAGNEQCCATGDYVKGGEGSCSCEPLVCHRRNGHCDCIKNPRSAFYPDSSCTGRVCCVIINSLGMQCSCDDSWSACPASDANTSYRTVSSCTVADLGNLCVASDEQRVTSCN